MLLPANLLGIVLALTSAAVWGAGDFSGGFAARRIHAFQALALSAISGIAILLVFVAFSGEGVASLPSMLWAVSAGAAGAVGIAALYRGLAAGRAASVAPTAAMVGAVIPVCFSILVEGMPGLPQLAGFLLAFPGIFLVFQATTRADPNSRPGFLLACLAGLGFGGFFILIAQVEPGKVFLPLLVARTMTLCTALVLLRVYRLPFPRKSPNPAALLAGVLDVGGNIFYLLAKQYTRLDVAVVLVSLYPAVTVILAQMILKETVSNRQWVGISACLAAIALIAL